MCVGHRKHTHETWNLSQGRFAGKLLKTPRANKKIEIRFRCFERRCLRRTLRVHLGQRVTNKDVSERTNINSSVDKEKQRR
ncbi:hypothetical protein LSAT2_017513 [Lamellibrachia satsuma]|nr:hypothetical protein LSAT2_017513 [Lamellibrachia satsuma]